MDLKHKFLWLTLLVFTVLIVFLAVNTNAMLHLLVLKASRSISGTLEIEKVQGRLIGPIKLQQLHFSLDGSDIHIAEINIDWNPISFLFDNIHIVSLDINDIDITLSTQSSNGFSLSTSLQQINLSHFLPIEIESGMIRNIRIHKLSSNETIVINDIKLSGKKRHDKLFINNLAISSPGLSLSASGIISSNKKLNITGNIHWDYQQNDSKKLTGSAIVQGDVKSLKINLELNQPGNLKFVGLVDHIDGDLEWRGKLQVSQFNYTRYFNDIDPALSGLISGDGNLKGDLQSLTVTGIYNLLLPDGDEIKSNLDLKYTANVLNISQADFSLSNSNSKLKLHGKLALDTTGWIYQGNAMWQDISWPLISATPMLTSSGEASGRFSINDYNLKLQNTSVRFNTQTLNNIQATLIGDDKGVDITEINGIILNSSITGKTRLNWESDLSWNSSLFASHFNPAEFNAALKIPTLALWPGDISATIKSSGQFSNNKISTKLKFSDVKGQLRGKPVNAFGDLTIDNDTYSSRKIQIVHGDTVLKVSGKLRNQWDLKWDIARGDLDMIAPNILGDFASKGIISGQRQQPRIIAELEVSNIEINQAQKIDNIMMKMDLDLSNSNNSSFVAMIKNIQYQDYNIDDFNIIASGLKNNNTITATAKSGKDLLTIKLSGAIGNLKNSDQEKLQWHGTITEGSLQSETAGNWHLLPSSEIKVSRDSIELPESCWRNNKARWCLETHWETGQRLDATMSLSDVPISFFQSLLNKQFRPNGLLNGFAELHVRDEKIESANIALNVSKGSIDMVLDKEVTRLSSFQSGSFRFDQTSNLINSSIVFQFEDQEYLTAEVELHTTDENSISIRDWPITGRLQSNSHYPDFIRLFYTAIKDIKGEWQSDIRLSGTFNKPVFSGYSNTTSSLILIPAAGLELKDVSLKISSDIAIKARNKFTIYGGFLSGPGSVTISGQLIADPARDWPVHLDVSGSNVQIFNAKESLVEISPNLKFDKTAGRVDVNGTIDISRALIKMKDAFPYSIKISNDIVFVNKHASSQQEIRHKQSRWDIYSKIKYTLNDKVYFDGYGISGGLTGDVTVIAEPGKSTVGQGALHIKQGRYKFFSTVLDLDIGRLIFENDFIENPAINARASKRSGDITAGVRLTGHLQSPEVSIYSIPSMPESDAVSYLLFGRVLRDNSFGLDSIKKIGRSGSAADDSNSNNSGSYIDYAVGLLSSTSVLRIRFELNKNWELYTESSATYSSAEIIYTFER